tara:strand:- start:416 stop:1024 length:609 start_codon:yes stop_codon:yes gene_type:complete
MNTKFNYYCYENAIPHHICDEIISLINNSKRNLGVIGGTSNDDPKGVNKKIRKSHVAFDHAWWVYRWTHPYIRKGNEDGGWNFEWDFSEPFQLTEYRPGEFYKWHTDQFHIPFGKKDSPSMKGKIRKLSSVVALNDGADYEGGELEFYKHTFNGKDWHDSPAGMRKKGSIVVFPSFIWHRVKPVKKGVRLSLTNWHLGQPFK